jgi:glucose/arabinose dehydrogenase
MKVKLFFGAMFFLFTVNIHAQFSLENAFPNLTFLNPVDLQHAGDGTDRIFIVEQNGKIKVFQNSASAQIQKTFLDIEDRVSAGGEMGLLGLAFHPDYETNGYFYVNYTTSNPMMTRISRFQVSVSNPDSADKNSELIILTFNQPYANHNGGWVGFGPNDGYLYIGVGDGGSAGDPQNNGQNITTLLGKILRIDIDNQAPGLEYAIPFDNPFVDSTGNVRKEIYAWGLRNPWRNSFDTVTGLFWSADVGQNQWEEIDIIESGNNYGWRCYEGNHTYNSSNCNFPEYVSPIWEYSHSSGCSITGGYVYRGQNVPELTGKYIYADYCNATIWALEYNGINPPVNQTLLTAPGSVVSFGIDQDSELYVLTAGPDRIYRFTPTLVLTAPTNLVASATGPNEVIVNWDDNNTQEQGFKIERKIDEQGIYAVIDSVNENIVSYTDNSTVENTIYYYRVFAYLDQFVSEYSNEDSAKTPFATRINNLTIPVEYNLRQNYPNPFNPTTKITFSLPETSYIVLTIYNSLGMEVDTISQGLIPAGNYESTWNAFGYASGIYYLKMTAESSQSGMSYSNTIKMILLK